MNAIQRTLRAVAAFCFFSGVLHAGATVIIDDAAVSPFAPPPRQILRLTQSIPLGQGEFAIFLDPLNSSQVRFTYAGIAEVYALYATSVGTAFDPAFALSTVPLVTNSPMVQRQTWSHLMSGKVPFSPTGMTATSTPALIAVITMAGFS